MGWWQGQTRGKTLCGAFPAQWNVCMINEIYNRKILEFAADIPRLYRLDAPDATATAISRLCGSKVTVDVRMADGVVSDFGHEVKACALGQASSSIMARHVVGATPEELRQIRGQMYSMLKEGGAAPTGKWAELEALLPVRDFKARHASTLLTFDAVVDALDQIEAKAKVPA
jgi:NifU-like protein involved in Fe-S cluster formation